MTTGPDGHQEPTQQQPDYLDTTVPATRSGRRWGVVAAAALGVAAVGAAGTWGLASFLSAGPSPATALPADTYAYLALDMDPAAGQKLAAWETLRKFPAIRDELGLDSGDDIRRWVYEAVTSGSDCEVEFEEVDDWLGGKAAIAVVPDGDAPAPVGVLEVTDDDAAGDGVSDLAACAEAGAKPGLAFVDGFLVVAEKETTAERVAAAAGADSLADDATHRRWLDAAGEPGVLAAYVAPSAPMAMLEQMSGPAAMPQAYAGRPGALVSPDDPFEDLPEDMLDEMPAVPMPMGPMFPGVPEDVEKALEEFEGLAMVVRFADGALEGEVVTALPDEGDLPEGSSGIADLPDTTALAFGMPTGEGWVQAVLDSVEAQMGEDVLADGIAELERETGLSVPEDIDALVGDGISVAVDSSADLSGFFGFGMNGPETIPVGLRIAGDPAEIRPVLDQLLSAVGPAAGDVVVVDGDGAVAVGLDPAYTEMLAGDGGLGDTDAFSSAMAGMDDSNAAFFLDFDNGGWLDGAVEEGSEDAENLEPLDALGFSSHADDDVARMVFRLTTD